MDNGAQYFLRLSQRCGDGTCIGKAQAVVSVSYSSYYLILGGVSNAG